MTCADTHGPQVAALSTAVTAVNAGTDPLCTGTTPCPTRIVRDAGIEAVEDSVFCDVMCCCRTSPGTGARQRCVQETLDRADQMLGYQSRYKAEFSYNMTTVPPSPFMHRGGAGQQRSTYWQGRAQSEIPGYTAGSGMVRRPDIVVVRDPTAPPQAPNIERVIEQKFAGDPENMEQLAAYQAIAGPTGSAQIQTEGSCDCGNDQRRRVPFPAPLPASQNDPSQQPVPIPVPAPAPVPAPPPLPAPENGGVGGWTLFGLGVVAAAAILSPFDGPVGDIAAGGAFLTALGAQ